MPPSFVGTGTFIISLFLLVVGLGAVAGASFRTNRTSATVTNLQQAAKSWREAKEAQDGEIAVLRGENASLREQMQRMQVQHAAQIADLEGRITVLQDTVTGRADIETLKTQVGDYIEAWHEKVGEMLALTAETRGEVHDLHEALAPAPAAAPARRTPRRAHGPGPAAAGDS